MIDSSVQQLSRSGGRSRHVSYTHASLNLVGPHNAQSAVLV
jgi:hypothetical protein